MQDNRIRISDATATLVAAYFPDSVHRRGEAEVAGGPETLLTDFTIIAGYLQNALRHKSLLEIRLDQSTRIFFTTVAAETKQQSTPKNTGTYLYRFRELLIHPLTPSKGNKAISASRQVVCRFFDGTTAFEFGTTFLEHIQLHGRPVIRLQFPVIGRINKHYRPYRVYKAPEIEAVAVTTVSTSAQQIMLPMINISATGMGFELPHTDAVLSPATSTELALRLFDRDALLVRGIIRHRSRQETDQSDVKDICGLQFDLETRSLSEEIEKIAQYISKP